MEFIKYLAIIVCVTVIIWIIATGFAKLASSYEVIEPRDNVECVVVSRMFNTSVDCWRTH